MTAAAGGPWLKAALFCERAVVDNGVLSAVGILDQLEIAHHDPVRLTLLLVVIRGDWAGPFETHLVARSPTGDAIATIDLTVDLPRAPEASGQVLVPITLAEVHDGVYWFELYLRDVVVTRVPLRIALRGARAGGGHP